MRFKFRSLRLALFLTMLTTFPSMVSAEVDFVKEIQPILKERCYECHGAETREAGLRLDQKDEALAGSDSGQVIKPEEARESLLYQLIAGDNPDRLMPPDGDNLTPKQISTIAKWINEGAHWPDGVDPKQERPTHWAYQPLSKFPAKSSENNEHPIDQLINERLSEKNITPSALADRYTLIKRLHYDLLGLPPTTADVDQFLIDESENAYEALVDKLLASPHFGERWGRHWLDQARYADSDGYEKDRPRYNAWKYRDWVIDAVNKDMPFDQFTVEQIAGDQIPNASTEQLLATAFHRQTLTNTEGGTDQEEFRVAAIFDRVETIGTVWLGLTIGCARCHSHKYDSISQREYYEFFAFFNNGDETSVKVPTSESAWQKYLTEKTAFDVKLKELQAPLDERKKTLEPGFADWLTRQESEVAVATVQGKLALELKSVIATSGAELKPQDDGSYLATGDRAVQDVYELRYGLASDEEISIAGVRLEMLTDKSLAKNGPGSSSGGNFVLSEITADVVETNQDTSRQPFASASADFAQNDFQVAKAIDGIEDATGWAVAPQTGKPHSAMFWLKEPIASKPGAELLIRLSQQYSANIHTLGRFRVTLLSSAEKKLSDFPEEILAILKTPADKRDAKQQAVLKSHYFKQDADFQKLNNLVEAHQKKPPFDPRMDVRIVKQRTKDERQTHVMKRGDFLQPLGTVNPGTLDILPQVESAADQQPTRLDFAKWLVSAENPLPPRVFANHVWAHLFGRGIVATANDFGVRGEAPTHPELLDWLARYFVEHGWSRKQLIKTIVLSDAYRRSSQHRPELAQVDPTNQLLYRQNRFRVEAEIVRDLHLAASGLLQKRIGGPSVFPPIPPDIAALSYANNFKWGNSDWNSRPDRPHGVAPKDDIYRRGMYTFFKRTAAHPNLITFDCPDSNTTCVERNTSNTPLQALQTLNNNVFIDASKAMAASLLDDESLQSDSDRLRILFRRCLVRNLDNNEMTILQDVLNDSIAYYTNAPAEAAALVDSKNKETAIIQAAWISVARIVMNLDEFIMRE